MGRRNRARDNAPTMGLLDRLLKTEPRSGAPSVPPSATAFQDSGGGPDSDPAARTAVRRELVQVTLRETMRRHAVPSDWLEVRMLPVVSRRKRSGLHVQLVVRQGQGSLLTYIPSFQSSFMAEIEKFDPRAWEWLLSISWQFAAITSTSAGEMPSASDWRVTAPGAAPAAAHEAPPAAAASGPTVEDDVEEDLQALFAIRDAALQGTPAAEDAQPDFEPTQPGAEDR